jgi:hypothetical protein
LENKNEKKLENKNDKNWKIKKGQNKEVLTFARDGGGSWKRTCTSCLATGRHHADSRKTAAFNAALNE